MLYICIFTCKAQIIYLLYTCIDFKPKPKHTCRDRITHPVLRWLHEAEESEEQFSIMPLENTCLRSPPRLWSSHNGASEPWNAADLTSHPASCLTQIRLWHSHTESHLLRFAVELQLSTLATVAADPTRSPDAHKGRPRENDIWNSEKVRWHKEMVDEKHWGGLRGIGKGVELFHFKDMLFVLCLWCNWIEPRLM